MRQTKLFGKTRKDVSRDEKSTNAELLTKASFIEREIAGVYNYLPLGFKVYQKIEQIIREEMNKIDGQEMLMTALQSKEVWDATKRWDGLEEIMYQFRDNHGSEIGLATTHEEPITNIVKKHVESYKDLPIYLYQIQTKFRNERRVKSGIIRGREFEMKDLYSFHTSQSDLDKFYQIAHEAYLKIFKRLGLEAFSVEASGGDMSKEYSHEFMVKTEAGEDVTILCDKCAWAQNAEIAKIKKGDKCPKCGAKVTEAKTVEAGNIFRLGNKYSSSMGLQFTDQDGKKKDVIMGSYGIGLGRAMGTIVEASHDKDGIIWTKTTTPYHIHLLNFAKNVKKQARVEKIYNDLNKAGFEVLYDDRDISFGKKLKDADLIGICFQLIVNETKEDLELVFRADHKKVMGDYQTILKSIKEFYK